MVFSFLLRMPGTATTEPSGNWMWPSRARLPDVPRCPGAWGSGVGWREVPGHSEVLSSAHSPPALPPLPRPRRFPFSRPELLKEWVLNMGRANFKPKQHTVICSEHFRPECFSAFGNRKNLKHNAVPTLFAFQDATQVSAPVPSLQIQPQGPTEQEGAGGGGLPRDRRGEPGTTVRTAASSFGGRSPAHPAGHDLRFREFAT